MQIKMRAVMAGPNIQAQAGDVIEVDAKTGKELIDGGYAEAFEAPAKSKRSPVVESASLEGGHEKAVKQDPAPRRRG